MERFRVGCSGWGYDDWVGPFYPPGTPAGDYLARYARVFDLAEVDSSFYRAPTPFLTRRWATTTPDDFTFTLKVPRAIIDATPAEIPESVAAFCRAVEPIVAAGKLGALVAQYPPSFRRETGLLRLQALLTSFPVELPLAVELRHGSWWVPATRTELEGRSASLVWSVAPGVRPPFWITGSFAYVRFLGDRALQKFDHLQRDYREEMEVMRRHLEEEGRSAREAFLLVNNHFMGYGPGTAQVLREVLGLPPLDLTLARTVPGQRQLS
ncbi:MAG: DUF72 domain-containing protein [Thermoplasmata archaeon]|nr:DUF72 domain-containing protein [Thermoplasmata archaeon]